jgi:hypothetical protein
MKHETTVTDHPASNGMVERKNQEVAKHLRCLAAEQSASSHWSRLLPFVQRIINTTPNSTTGHTPMRIVFGLYGQDSPLLVDTSSSVEVGEASIQSLLDSQNQVLVVAQQNQADYLDGYLTQEGVTGSSLNEGDLVLAIHRGDRAPSKLSPRYRGPYKVLRRTGTNRYDVQHLATDYVMDVHLEDLKPYDAPAASALEAATLDTTIDKESLVDSIVDHKFVTKAHRLSSIRFKIRWMGWGPGFDTWEKYQVVQELEALDRYLQEHPDLSRIVPSDSSRQDLQQVPVPAFKRGGVKATPDSSSMATDPVEQEERLARPLARGSREQPRPKFSAAVSLRV